MKKNTYKKQYEDLKKKVIKDIKDRYRVLHKKYKDEDDFFRDSLNDDYSIFIDVLDDDDFDNYDSCRFISDIDLFGVTVSNNSWGEVGELSYKELSFEVLSDLLDRLNLIK